MRGEKDFKKYVRWISYRPEGIVGEFDGEEVYVNKNFESLAKFADQPFPEDLVVKDIKHMDGVSLYIASDDDSLPDEIEDSPHSLCIHIGKFIIEIDESLLDFWQKHLTKKDDKCCS